MNNNIFAILNQKTEKKNISNITIKCYICNFVDNQIDEKHFIEYCICKMCHEFVSLSCRAGNNCIDCSNLKQKTNIFYAMFVIIILNTNRAIYVIV